MNIMLICAERSGENLLHTYLDLLLKKYPTAHFYCQTSFDRFVKEELNDKPNCHFLADRSLCSVMGLIEPIKRIIPLWRRTQFLKKQIALLKPALVIGFDGPDFCLRLEKMAKEIGSYAVHVVCPSVWAWREGRVWTVDKSAHEIHHLFAFEKPYYEKTRLIAEHIGHPLLKKITPSLRKGPAKTLLLVPGSRSSEIKRLLPILIKIALELKVKKKISKILISRCPDVDPRLYPQEAHGMTFCDDFYGAIEQADFAIACSGTATLEIAAHGCPLVVVYYLASWKKYLLSFFIKLEHISLPNIILKERLLPEFIGDLNKCYKQILDVVSESISSDRYKTIASNLYEKMQHMMQKEKAASIETILDRTCARAEQHAYSHFPD